MFFRRLHFAVLVAFVSPALLAAEPARLEGRVIKVTDGDTLILLVDKTRYEVKLAGIDAPEEGQPYGEEAKQALSVKVFGKTIKVLPQGKDYQKRTLGVVYLDGCINAQLVKEGWAWHYVLFSNSKVLAKAEQEARKAKAGLWAGPKAIPPWEWRRTQRAKPAREKAKAGPEAKAEAAQTAPGKRKKQQPGAPKTAKKAQDDQTVYVGRADSKYHRKGCRRLAKDNFPVPLKAAARRYSPCEFCKPPTVGPAPSSSHWLIIHTGVRHNSSCTYYRKGRGRPCGPNEGRPCNACGG